MKFLLTVLSLSFLSLSGYGQSRDEIIEDFIEQRKKMMEQMIEMFHDDFNGDSFFQDDFDPFDSFSNMKSFSGVGSQIKIEEKYEEDGTISLIITPQKDNLSLDIKTTDNMITIKSEQRVQKHDEQEGGSFKSMSHSSFSRSISVPQGYKAQSPVPAGKGLKISLVPSGEVKEVMRPKNSKKKYPIGKRPGEDTL